MKFYHQGDVPFYEHKGKIEGEKVTHKGSLVLAFGEATGHHHTITVPDLTKMDAYKLADGGWILTLREEGSVTHQEHGEITLAPGTYRVGRERELDWNTGMARNVID